MGRIELQFQQGDLRTFPTDVVVLKYAQRFDGSSHTVVAALGQEELTSPSFSLAVGEFRSVETHGRIKAQHVLLIGVPSVGSFGYRDIRAFSARALQILAEIHPHTRHIAMNIHGVGYGLDEIESLLAQLAGYTDALEAGQVPRALSTIVILTRSATQVENFCSALDQHVRNNASLSRGDKAGLYFLTSAHEAESARPSLSGNTSERAGKDSSDKPHAFVAMPFHESFDDIFYFGIQEPIKATGFLCERTDQEAFIGGVLELVKHQIETATFVVADVTGANPNVLLEVGYAWGKGRPTILVTQDPQTLPFDLLNQKYLSYHPLKIKTLAQLLTQEITALKSKGHF